jgi:predicted amidohydrolase
MAASVRLAMIQQPYGDFERDANFAKAMNAIRDAAAQGADIVCTPEMFLTGYPHPRDGQEWDDFVREMHDTAEPVDGPYSKKLAALAGELGIHLIASMCETRDGKLYNSAFLYGPDGLHIGTYAKVHVCRFSKMEDLCDDGDDWYVWPLEINGRTVRLGIMICYDREHPESARVLMLKGAHMIIVPNACDIEEKRLGQLQARAFENACVVAMSNHGAPMNGHSVIYNEQADTVALAGEGEEILIGDVDIDEIEDYQSTTIWGDHYRRVEKYSLITS